MAGVNKAILLGNLGKDPEVRRLDDGRAVVNFSLATSESYKNKAGERVTNTEWHNIVSIGKQADFVTEYIKKGQLICIEGKLRTQKWEDKNKVTHYKTEILADSVTPVEWRDENKTVVKKVSEPENGEEDLPF